MPTRVACGRSNVASAVSSSRASARCSARDDSTSVMARETSARRPARIPSASAGTSTCERGVRHQLRSRASRSSADSAITVPGRNTAAAPISFSVATSSGGITPPITIMMSGRPWSASACLSAGSRVR